jgi:hypothetical protein
MAWVGPLNGPSRPPFHRRQKESCLERIASRCVHVMPVLPLRMGHQAALRSHARRAIPEHHNVAVSHSETHEVMRGQR